MSFLNKLFLTKKDKELLQQFKNLKQKVHKEFEAEYKPLGDIADLIINASDNCRGAIKPLIKGSDDQAKLSSEMYIFFEFIYFFMHVTLRVAKSKLNDQQLEKLMEYLVLLIPKTAIITFIGHWPEDYKSKATSEFIDNLNKAELEYSEAKEFYSENGPFDRTSLFPMLTHNICDLLKESPPSNVYLTVIECSFKEFQKMNIEEKIDSFIEGFINK